MKKIIIFNSGSSLYGSERGLISLVKALEGKYEIEIVLPCQGPLVDYFVKRGQRVTLFPLSILSFSYAPLYYLYNISLFLINFIYFFIYISLNKFDVIYTNNALMFFPACIAFFLRKKHIWHIREFFPNDFINKFIARFAQITKSTIICQSDNIRTNIFGLNSKDNISVIYEGLDINDYVLQENKQRAFNLPEDVVRVTLISRVHPSKGHYEILQLMDEVFKIVKTKAVLLLVGDITNRNLRNCRYKRKLEKFITQHGLTGRVLFCGFKENIVSVLDSTDICVFPYQRNEPFGLALLEALVLSKAVLLQLNPGSKEIFRYFNKECKELTLINLKNEIEKGRRGVQTPLIPEIFSFQHYKSAIVGLLDHVSGGSNG